MQKRAKGAPTHFIVVAAKSGGEFEMPLGGLNDAERQRVVTFVLSKMPR